MNADDLRRDLRRALRGTLITREEEDYASTRAGLLFNGRKPDRHPRLIVRAADVADVQTVVRFAAKQNLPISVLGSGHNWSGIALQDGILLDLGALNQVAIDADARIAEVGPAVTNRTLARLLSGQDLAFPVGHCGTVSLSGYLLGGGFGWNPGEWGIATFGVDSLDVVTADGELRRASATENQDVFWAARGGGPEFFGIVTRYRLRLRPLPHAITTSVWTYPIEHIAEVERWMSDAMNTGPSNVEFTAAMTSAPPPLTGSTAKVVSAIATVFADSAAEANATLARIGANAPAGALDVKANMPTPFDVLYDIMAQFFPDGARYAADAFWSNETTGGIFRGLADSVAAAPSPASFATGVILPARSFGPRELPDAAFSMLGRVFGAAYAIWTEPSEDESQRAWLRAAADALAPVTIGHYVGEADLERPERMTGCFATAAWTRLQALRQQHDPAGLFSSGPRLKDRTAA
jgi:FAD/FMN-containing dehydrogenase